MATWADEFNDRTHLDPLTDAFTSRWDATQTWDYRNAAWNRYPGRGGVRLESGSNGRELYSYDAAGTPADAEILCLVRAQLNVAIETYCGVVVRGGGSGASEDGYYARLRSGPANGLVLGKYTAGVSTALAQEGSSYAADTWHWIRLQASGTTIRAKRWLLGAAEPASWTLSVTDADHASGWVGIHNFDSGGRKDFASLRIGTGGDSAPSGPVTPCPPRLKAAAATGLEAWSHAEPGMITAHGVYSEGPYLGTGVEGDWDASQFRIRTTAGPGAWTTSSIVSVDLATNGYPSFEFGALSSETEYDLQERRRDSTSGEWSEWSESVVFETLVEISGGDDLSFFGDDFSEPTTDPTDDPPPNWELKFGTNPDGLVAGDDLATLNPYDLGADRFGYTPVAVADDVEEVQSILGLIDGESNTTAALGIHMKNGEGYFLEIDTGLSSNAAKIYRWDGGVSRTILAQENLHWDADLIGPGTYDYFWMELRTYGNLVQARYWKPGQTKPTWGSGAQQLSVSDTTYREGQPCIFKWNNISILAQEMRLQYVGFSHRDIDFTPPAGPATPSVIDVALSGPVSGIIEGSTYASLEGPAPAHTASRYRIALQSSPTDFILDVLIEDEELLEDMPFSGLPVDSALQVEIRYKDENEAWSDWSDPFNFTTPEADTPNTPTIALDYSIPTEASIRVTTPIPPTHEDAGTDVTKAQWQVSFTDGTFDEADLVLDDVTTDETGPFSLLELLLSDLDYEIDVWVRMRWIDEFEVAGDWSNTVNFTSEPEPPDSPDAPTIALVAILDLFEAQFSSSAYSSPVGSPQQASQWQVSWNQQWNRPLENEITTTVAEWTSWIADALMPGQTNYVRKRDQDSEGRWGAWSNILAVTPFFTPFPVKIISHKQGDVLTGVETFEWLPRPDDPANQAWYLEYSIDNGETWEREIDGLHKAIATTYAWDLSDFDDLTALLVRTWWVHTTTGQISRPAAYVYRVENDVNFTTIADLSDDELWTNLWQSYAADWVHQVDGSASGRVTSIAQPVQTTIPIQNPWRQGYLANGYDPLLEPDGADVIVQFRWASGFNGPSVGGGLKYLPRDSQYAGVALMAHGDVEDTGPPYDALDGIGVGGIRLQIATLEAPWPFGVKPCGWFLNRGCGIYSEYQQRGTSSLQMLLDVLQESSEIPYYRNIQTFPLSAGLEIVEVYASDFDMSCNRIDHICDGLDIEYFNCPDCEDLYRPSLPFALRLRVETQAIDETSGNRDFRIRAAFYGPGMAFPPDGWHVDIELDDVPMECGVCALVQQALQWYGGPSIRFENMSVIPLSYGDCVQPSAPFPEPPEQDFPCPPIDPHPVYLALGDREGGNVYLAEQSTAEESLNLWMDLMSAPVAPGGAGGEAVFTNIYPVFETRGQAHIIVTPYVDGRPRTECQLEFDIDHTSAPFVRKYEISLMAPFPVGAPVTTAALRGTWFQVQIEAYSGECEIDLTLHGVDLETEPVRESHPDRTYLALDVQDTAEPRSIVLYLGERAGGGIFETEQGSQDDGSNFTHLVESAPVAPRGVGGECVFTNLYIQLTRRNTSAVTLLVTPIVDEVAQEQRTLTLAGVSADTRLRESIEVSLFQKFTLDSLERETYVPRGTWFQVQLEIVDSDAPDLVTLDGVELEVEPVRESEEHAN